MRDLSAVNEAQRGLSRSRAALQVSKRLDARLRRILRAHDTVIECISPCVINFTVRNTAETRRPGESVVPIERAPPVGARDRQADARRQTSACDRSEREFTRPRRAAGEEEWVCFREPEAAGESILGEEARNQRSSRNH